MEVCLAEGAAEPRSGATEPKRLGSSPRGWRGERPGGAAETNRNGSSSRGGRGERHARRRGGQARRKVTANPARRGAHYIGTIETNTPMDDPFMPTPSTTGWMCVYRTPSVSMPETTDTSPAMPNALSMSSS